jgi:pimeloyl-ACP methyl ester carboxylesterase
LIHGRYDRMVRFEVSIAILDHIAEKHLAPFNNCGHWPLLEKPTACGPRRSKRCCGGY